ncbi:hypothetical protein G5S_0844 [Chlamydia pecorum E58]|uniref:Uncharacterized protein n=1 Tax=Chlamydia pecorum (strain ATCC VR-628 / DSM 29919 / E58) TaxID=331635 RepID=A0AA34WIB4_CHLPE|nr:hypothetical protein G5S_0844 [Chlamydia pecorum E58]
MFEKLKRKAEVYQHYLLFAYLLVLRGCLLFLESRIQNYNISTPA